MSEIEILIEFQTQLLAFLDELIGQFPCEGDLVILRLYLANQVAIKDVMDSFILNITKNDKELKKMIADRNENFFVDHSIFEEYAEKGKVSHFKKLWRSGQLDDDDKTVIWNWVDAFVYLSDKYVKVKK